MELVIDQVLKQYKNKIAVDRVSVDLKKGVHGLRHIKTRQRDYYSG